MLARTAFWRRSGRVAFGGLLALGLLRAAPVRAQDLRPVVNRQLSVKYLVPAGWGVTRQVSDSLSLLYYFSPDQRQQLWVGQWRGQLPPARALARLLGRLHVLAHEEHQVTAHGLDLWESNGQCRGPAGQPLRYEARVTTHLGQTLVLYYKTPVGANVPLLHQVLESLTPLPHRSAAHPPPSPQP